MSGRYWNRFQRQALERAFHHTSDAAHCRRLLALLQIDQGEPIPEVARFLHIDRRTIYRWIARYTQSQNATSLKQQPGQGRPPEWNEELSELLESALAQPPVCLGYPANGWTASLLQAFLSFQISGPMVSTRTIRRRLKELEYVWKRGRYQLPPDPEAEKKTLDFEPNTLIAQRRTAAGRG
jgi:transposase